MLHAVLLGSVHIPCCLSIRRAYSRARLSSRSTDSWVKEKGIAKLEGSEGSDEFNWKLMHRLRFRPRMVKLKLFEISIMPMARITIRCIDEEVFKEHECELPFKFKQKPSLMYNFHELWWCLLLSALTKRGCFVWHNCLMTPSTCRYHRCKCIFVGHSEAVGFSFTSTCFKNSSQKIIWCDKWQECRRSKEERIAERRYQDDVTYK